MKYYHVWFPTKRKRHILIEQIATRLRELIAQVAFEKEIRLLAHETMPDHCHLLLELESEMDLPQAVKNIKGISAREIFREFSILKGQAKINNLWAKRYKYKEIPEERLGTVIKYINNQRKDLL